MAGALGRYGKEKEARRKAAIKSAGGLVGDVVGLIPGAQQVGAGIKIAAGHLSGDDKMAATQMPKKDKGAERDKKIDAILAAMKRQKKKPVVEEDMLDGDR
jgi:hypothetical protein